MTVPFEFNTAYSAGTPRSSQTLLILPYNTASKDARTPVHLSRAARLDRENTTTDFSDQSLFIVAD